jgi:hypothetical protein
MPQNVHVCFTPESGHVQCTSSWLWAISGHTNKLAVPAPPSTAAAACSMKNQAVSRKNQGCLKDCPADQ